MSINDIILAYPIINFLLAIVLLIKSRQNFISQFYFLCIVFLSCYALAGYSYSPVLPKDINQIIEWVVIFLFSVFPFMFLHYLIIFIGSGKILKNKISIFAIYGVGIFSYTLILLGFIPKPVSTIGGLSPSGNFFFITWMSIYFSLGVTQLYILFGQNTDRGVKSNFLLGGFLLLLLFLPGPFSEAISSGFFKQREQWVFISSTIGLGLAVYLVFRHKAILTLYDAVKTAISVMNDILIRTDADMKILMVRGGFENLLAYDEEELIGKNLAEFSINDEYLTKYVQFVKKGRMKEGFLDVDMKSKDLRFLTINFSFTPIFENDEITGFVCVGRDVTERRIAEDYLKRSNYELEERVKERTEQLQITNDQLKKDIEQRRLLEKAKIESENLYQTLVETSTQGILLTDATGKIIFANKKHAELHGFDNGSQLIGLSITNLLDYSFHKKAGDAIKIIIEKQTISNIELLLKRKDNTTFWGEISATIIKDENENVKGILFVLNDIDERKKYETALQSAEEKFRSIFENSLDGIVQISTNGKIISCNSTSAKLFGYKETNELQLNINNFFEDCFMKYSDWEKLKTQLTLYGKAEYFKTEMIKKSGDLFWVSGNFRISGTNGQIDFYEASLRDITDQVLADAELIITKEKAEEANRLKSSLLMNLSHEFRTPLNGIIGLAQIIHDDSAEKSELKFMSNGILQAGYRLLTTLNSILELAQLESADFKTTFTDVNIYGLLPNIIYPFEKVAAEKKLYIKSESEYNDLIINIDPELLSKVMSHIIDNAIKYTFEGGVTISLVPYTERGIEFADIKVQDTGIGIAPENIEVIFKEFRQISEGYSRDYEGNGLGLTIAKKMVELMNGKIIVHSQLGKGSTFTVRFPLVARKKLTIDDAGTKKIKVNKEFNSESNFIGLIVEDNQINANIAQQFLSNYTKLDIVNNGQDALISLNKKKYNFILMDINLGSSMSGMDVMKKIREDENYKDLPIVALTGYALETDKNEFLKAGFSHFLAKPFNRESIVNLVKEILAK